MCYFTYREMRLTFLTKANVVKFVGEELLCNIYTLYENVCAGHVLSESTSYRSV